jgi:hypothetical protein
MTTTQSIPGLKVPDPGDGRYWEGKHQPNKKATPLRIELRERTNKTRSDRYVSSWTRLIAFEDTIADATAVLEAMSKILDRASAVDDYVGFLSNPGEVGE